MTNTEIQDLLERAIADTFNQVHYAHQHPDNFKSISLEKWMKDWVAKNFLNECSSVAEVKKSFSLPDLERKLDDALEKETKETLTAWLQGKRK